jgi:uncharacterized protein (DUF924 family)
MSELASIGDILDFWFLPLGDPDRGKLREIWFQSTPEFDAEVGRRFSHTLDQAVDGNLDSWAKSPDGALALILLCDQFPRHIHRRTARAFCGDAKAQWAARIAIGRFYAAAFNMVMRTFFYMPFQHSEDLADQELGCALFDAMENEEYMKHAIEHRDVVARFGRFPHRNDVLGRPCTPEELEYLKTANRYGQ